MLSFLKKNKIIIAVFLSLSIIISAFLLTKVDFNLLNLKFKKTISSLNKNFSALAQGISPYFFPRYPQRLMYLVDEMSLATEDLVYLNETLNESIEECDCKYAQSQCSSATDVFSCFIGLQKVFGDPCKNRREIDEGQKKVGEKTQELTFLQELLKKEMESGLKRELESLDPEVAEELRTNLEKILQDSQRAISLAENNYHLPEDCSVNQCSANCLSGDISQLDACFGVKGEQKPITLKFKISVGLNDLDLGQVRIKNVNLGLPEEIEIAKLGSLSPFTIAGEEFVIPLDNIQKTLRLQIPKLPSLPTPPSITLSCPGARPTACTFAKPAWEEPWCYCNEGERPLGWGKTKPYPEYRYPEDKNVINYCKDFEFESPGTKRLRIYTDATPGGGVIYIATDSCTDPDKDKIKTNTDDHVANGPTGAIWSQKTPNADGSQEYYYNFSGTGRFHAGVYNDEYYGEKNRSTSMHLCAPCDPRDPGYPYYGTGIDQCTGKLK